MLNKTYHYRAFSQSHVELSSNSSQLPLQNLCSKLNTQQFSGFFVIITQGTNDNHIPQQGCLKCLLKKYFEVVTQLTLYCVGRNEKEGKYTCNRKDQEGLMTFLRSQNNVCKRFSLSKEIITIANHLSKPSAVFGFK